jgi:hypothetical protein
MASPLTPIPELCAAEYSATRVSVPDGPAKIFVTAQGVHATLGYRVMFHTSPADVYPPEFSLWHIKPAGASPDVITPFTELTAFDETGQVQNVVVIDAAGCHQIPVKAIGVKLLHK